MTNQDANATTFRSPQQTAQMATFRTDPPIRASFPITLINGVVIPAFVAKCARCRQPIGPDWVHRRVYDSLPTVKTMDANAYCVPCEQFIHYDARFRAVGDTLQVEFTNGTGPWLVLRGEPASSLRTMKSRNLMAKAGSLFGDDH